MKTFRVSLTKVTLEYFEVDVDLPETQHLKPDYDWAIMHAQQRVHDEPHRHKLGDSNEAIIITASRQV